MYIVEEYCAVNKGIVKDTNQDNIFINKYSLALKNNGINKYNKSTNKLNNKLCYGVFDGIGGLDKGEHASYFATNMLSKYYLKNDTKKILNYINQLLNKKNNEDNIKMGTTASILEISGKNAIISLVGDSCVFILSDGNFTKYIEENDSPNILENYLGNDKELNIKQAKIKLKNKDKIIICSDGLTKSVGELEIEYIMDSSDDVVYITNKLVNDSLLNGGKDNVSVITLLIKKDYKQYIYLGICVLFILFIIIMLCI